MFGVQITVDACPLFVLKRRSFLFVIDTIIFTQQAAEQILLRRLSFYFVKKCVTLLKILSVFYFTLSRRF